MKKIISALFAVTLVFGFISNANAAKTFKVPNCDKCKSR